MQGVTEEKPVDEEIVARMLHNLRTGSTDLAPEDLRVPASHFVSDAHAAAERAALRRLPLIVGHASELPGPGSFITRTILGTPLLIVRKADGGVAAYRNICSHRGAKVELAESGTKPVFVCSYHGWAYERDSGAIRGVPFEKQFESLDRACIGLPRVAIEERHGMLWLDFSNDPERNLEDFLGAAADMQLASFGLERSMIFLDEKFELDINWKLIVEGAIDGSHLTFLHRDSVANFIQNNCCVWADYGRHGALFMSRKKFAESVAEGGSAEGAWRNFSSNIFLYPNSMVIAAPDHVEFWTVWPDDKSASRATVHIRFYIPPEKLDDRIRGRMSRSWEILQTAAMNEDWPIERTIQENLESDPAAMVTYGRHEIGCQHLHRELRADMGEAWYAERVR